MKKSLSLILVGCLAAGLIVAPWLLHGAEPPKAAPSDKPSADKAADKAAADKSSSDEAAPVEAVVDFRDPAFAKYVDMRLLAKALAETDAAALTDAGLQLAEGERVLLRQHKGLSAAKVLEWAAKYAAEKSDKATLDRLAKAADARSDKELADQVASAKKLAGGTRAPNPALSVSVEQTTPEAFAFYKSQLDRIKAARLAGDRAALESMEKEAGKLDTLAEPQRQLLAKEINEALTALPKDSKADPTVLALNKLASASRGGPHFVGAVNLPILALGVKATSDQAAGGWRVTAFTDNGPIPMADGSTLSIGDVITRIGNSPALGNGTPTQLINRAYQQGAQFIIVVDGQGAGTFTLPLP